MASVTDSVLLVDYAREHFELEGHAARLTLDYDIRYTPTLGRRRLGRSFSERMDRVALIEVKFAEGETVPVERALRSVRARATRFSKYVVGCQRLGYLPEI